VGVSEVVHLGDIRDKAAYNNKYIYVSIMNGLDDDNANNQNEEHYELQSAQDSARSADLLQGLDSNNKQKKTNILAAKNSRELSLKVQDLWGRLKTKNDLLYLLNVVYGELYGERSTMLTIGQLNHYAYSAIASKRYTTFQIPKKKKGEYRTIDAPVQKLKYIQRGLNVVLQCAYTPHAAAMGFVPHRSVVDNAKVHTGQRVVYNIDLKDFFPSITSGRVYHRLKGKPFSLNEELASLITDICCYTNAEGRHVLPQGAPTSPTLTNIICERMDRKLTRLAKAYSLKYTRYADDITFSGMTNVFQEGGRFCRSLRHIIEVEEHFTINNDKVRLYHQGMRQEVTGLTVNHRENVSRKYIKQLRTLIHNWEMNGYQKAQEVFIKHYAVTSTCRVKAKGEHHIENIISGKLMYLKMVKGESDITYRRLFSRFLVLINEHTAANMEEVKASNSSAMVPSKEGGKHIDAVHDEGKDEVLITIMELEALLNNNI